MTPTKKKKKKISQQHTARIAGGKMSASEFFVLFCFSFTAILFLLNLLKNNFKRNRILCFCQKRNNTGKNPFLNGGPNKIMNENGLKLNLTRVSHFPLQIGFRLGFICKG